MHPPNPLTWLDGILADAALLPPCSAPIGDALAAYEQARAGRFAPQLGNLVVTDVKVPDLIDTLEERTVPISLLVTGGAGAVGGAVRWACRAPVVNLASIELLLRDEDDLARNAQRFIAALDACEDDISEVPTFVELPRPSGGPTAGWLRALDEIASVELGVKFRIGGQEGSPAPAEIAAWFDAALDRELAFTCVGGLGRAVTGTDPETGAVQYGLLNLVLGVRGCLDGENSEALLTAPGAVGLIEDQDSDALARTRRWLHSVSVADALEACDDLVELGLLGSD